MITSHFDIAGLIAKYLSGDLKPEEQQQLSEWRTRDIDNEKLFLKICDSENFRNYYTNCRKYNKKKGWDLLNKRIRTHKRRKFISTVARYAAVFFIPLIVALSIWYISLPNESVTSQIDKQTVYILPGEKKATLTLNNGNIIELKNIPETTTLEKDGISILIDSAALNYQLADVNVTDELIYNKVEVPHGGEYSLVLSDGTKVYLNSMTNLRFPVRFQGQQREVELEGEAYFDVFPDSKPFIVKYNNVAIEVLGTSFNVSAYPQEESHTTLVNGSVKVSLGTGATAILKPSEQALIQSGSDKLSIREVDVSLFTSWIDGKIYFKDERLEDIMNYLSRWYDMNVFYSEPSIKNLRFGCNLNRYKDITPFLELIEQTDKVHIAINGKKITFKHNN